MKLFRGDNIKNQLTEPHLYRFDGLRTKAFGKGDPAYVRKNGILDCVRKHIKPESIRDKAFYNATDFISFSLDIERAFYWLRDQNKLQLKECQIDYTETRYLFEFDIPDTELIRLEAGVYSYKYICNPSLKTSNFLNPVFNATLPLMYGVRECPICDIQSKNHEIILIDTQVFLQEHRKEEKFTGAYIYAEKDKEWLILPFDTMDSNGFKYARIPRADFWIVRQFIGNEEINPFIVNA